MFQIGRKQGGINSKNYPQNCHRLRRPKTLFLEVSEQNKNSLIFNLKSRKIGHREHGRGELILKSLGTLSLSVKFLFSMPHVSQSVNVCTVSNTSNSCLFPPPSYRLTLPPSRSSYLSSVPLLYPLTPFLTPQPFLFPSSLPLSSSYRFLPRGAEGAPISYFSPQT